MTITCKHKQSCEQVRFSDFHGIAHRMLQHCLYMHQQLRDCKPSDGPGQNCCNKPATRRATCSRGAKANLVSRPAEGRRGQAGLDSYFSQILLFPTLFEPEWLRQKFSGNPGWHIARVDKPMCTATQAQNNMHVQTSLRNNKQWSGKFQGVRKCEKLLGLVHLLLGEKFLWV